MYQVKLVPTDKPVTKGSEASKIFLRRTACIIIVAKKYSEKVLEIYARRQNFTRILLKNLDTSEIFHEEIRNDFSIIDLFKIVQFEIL